MMLLQLMSLARFAGEWRRDTQRLRRSYPGLAEE